MLIGFTIYAFLLYYNYQKKVTSLKYITPYDKIIEYYNKRMS